MNHMQKAIDAATLGTCRRRKIGCAAYAVDGSFLASASNGRSACLGSCLDDTPCPGADIPAGQGGADCRGIHAEERLFMSIPMGEIHALYSTKAPCTGCTLKAIEHGVKVIRFLTQSNETKNAEIAASAGVDWRQM